MDKPYTRSQEEQAPQITQTRKPQIDSDSPDEPLVKRKRLTRKNLALFDKMGEEKVTDSTDKSGSTKATSTTTSGFAIKAYKNGIALPVDSKTPTNLKARRKRGAKSRGTASPTESEHGHYVKRIRTVNNEATMVFEVGRKLLKEYNDKGSTSFDQAFTGFPKDVGFNNGLSAPQPDFIEGPQMNEFGLFPVDEHISGAVLYKDNPHSITLPHLAGELKGCGKDMKRATLQSSYSGAALVYARNQALSYLGKSDPPGHAEITTFTTDGTNLNFYSHYVAQTEDKTLQYHQYPDASYNLMNFNGYKDGRRHLRNTQDDSRDKSYDLRDQLKEHYKQQCCTLPSIAQGTPLPTPPVLEPANAYKETTQYGDEAGDEIIKQPCQPTPTASTKPHRASHSHSSGSSHNSNSNSRKRKASSSQASSHGSPGHASKRSYWEKDPKTGNYYHKHSDGTVSWLADDNDDDNDDRR